MTEKAAKNARAQEVDLEVIEVNQTPEAVAATVARIVKTVIAKSLQTVVTVGSLLEEVTVESLQEGTLPAIALLEEVLLVVEAAPIELIVIVAVKVVSHKYKRRKSIQEAMVKMTEK